MEVTPIPKDKRVHLSGRALRKLNAEIYLRDKGRCIYCNRHVTVGTKFHHEPCGVNKSDEITKGVLLCQECHYRRHNSAGSELIREACVRYLKDFYRSDNDED